MRYLLTLSYIGKNYSGWQSQKNQNTVQSVVEKALSQVLGEQIKIHSAGRTDEGVHAIGQTAHFDSKKEFKPFSIAQATNLLLPSDVSITNVQIVDSTFHARKSAKAKTYLYKLYVSSSRNAYLDTTHSQIYKMPNVELMQSEANCLVGIHDFSAFKSTGSTSNSNVKEIYSIQVKSCPENVIEIHVRGNAFLYNMMRIIVGTLVQVGLGKLPQGTVPKMLKTGNRKLGGKTFPPQGLCLLNVEY